MEDIANWRLELIQENLYLVAKERFKDDELRANNDYWDDDYYTYRNPPTVLNMIESYVLDEYLDQLRMAKANELPRVETLYAACDCFTGCNCRCACADECYCHHCDELDPESVCECVCGCAERCDCKCYCYCTCRSLDVVAATNC